MEKNMYYSIYKITNKIDGKIYIGCHKTNNLDDGYMGSGKYLKRALEKHGVENFEKEILKVFDNPEQMFEMESELVNGDFVKREDTYNLKEGGSGGWEYINENIPYVDRGFDFINKNNLNNKVQQNLKGSNKHKELLETNLEYRENWIKGLKENCNKAFKGKKHTDEAKRKIGEANSKHQKGEGNSQYGTMWIHSLTEKVSKRINKDDFSKWKNNGWLKGRKMKFL